MKKIIYTLNLIFFLITFLLVCPSCNEVLAQTPIPAFPGAEGFGSDTVGGRGGKVIEVTNLNDSGSGSLRACIEASGPRICVFRIGGTIELQSTLRISNSNIYIAGQTAPGGGITLKNKPGNTSRTLLIVTHDVVIRYIRSRPGPSLQPSQTLDAIEFLNGANNVVVDHCSASWATDEVVSTWYAPQNITFQWSIISESLNNSTHDETTKQHAKGLLLGSSGSGNMSIHHNLLAHHPDRVPYAKTGGLIDFVNNVIYDAGNRSNFGDDYSRQRVNYVANYYKAGPNSSSESCFRLYSPTQRCFEIYVQGNTCLSSTIVTFSDSTALTYCGNDWQVFNRHSAPTITTYNANQAYDRVLSEVGASQMVNTDGSFSIRRDAVDKRIIAETQYGGGKYIDGPGVDRCFYCSGCDPCRVYLTSADYTKYGIYDPIATDGWPILEAGTAYTDDDCDGMADDWEINKFGNITTASSITDAKVDPNNSSRVCPTNTRTTDYDNDGYTDLEEFLNGTNPKGANLSPSPTNPVSKPGDANNDGRVTIADYIIWLNHYGMTTGNGPQDGDFDNSGSVGIADYIIWLNNYGV